MPVPIRPATPADAHVPGLIARAFDDDPWVNFLTKQDARREERILSSFERAFARALSVGEAYVAEDGTGASLWFLMDTPPRGVGGLRQRLQDLRRTVPIAGLDRVLTAYRARSKVGAAHPQVPHWELRILGVEPGRQGGGIGASLVRPVLERLDIEGHLTALTCTKERNVPLYEHLGFHVTSEVRVSPEVRVWVMERPPGG